jgi:hypothetical protein
MGEGFSALDVALSLYSTTLEIRVPDFRMGM